VIRLLFVCTGNICRSPTAEGVMRAQLAAAGLADRVEVDSCGLGHWHVGELPDARTRATARRRGVELTHRARQLGPHDLERFDYVLALDGEHLDALERLARARTPRAHIALLRSFEPDAPAGAEVPDPYYGGDDGFEEVYDLCERACAGLVDHLRAELAR
jgi:protein-tyrosine phosphatase